MNFVQVDVSDLFLGIDGGGSNCRALLADAEGRVLGAGSAGPANPFQNLVQARESIVQAAAKALVAAGLPEDAMDRLVAGVGLAGVNIPSCRQQMLAWQHPFREFFLTTDIHIACLGANGGEDGAVLVAGTGSVGYRRDRGTSRTYGAHGFPFGDKGSGAWLGLEGLKAALLALDGLGPDTALLPVIEQHLGAADLALVDAMAGARPRDYGALAPLVLAAAEAGDTVALGIVHEGADYLDRLARKLLQGGGDFALLGGLAPRIASWLSADVRAALVPPLDQPDRGALRFAMSEFAAAKVG